jgi:hypothetical protein
MLLFIHDLLIIHITLPLNELVHNFLQGFKPPGNLFFTLNFAHFHNFPHFAHFSHFRHFALFPAIHDETGIFEGLVIEAEIGLVAGHAADETEQLAIGQQLGQARVLEDARVSKRFIRIFFENKENERI